MLRFWGPLTLTLILGDVAAAGIVGGAVTGGQVAGQGAGFVQLSPSSITGIGYDRFETIDLLAFTEAENVAAPVNITPQIGAPISAGEIVSSHSVFFDPPPSPHISQIGYVDFDARVMSIVTSSLELRNTDRFGPTNIAYRAHPARGLEESDKVWIDPDNPYRVWVSWFGSTPGDQVRVFTQLSNRLSTVPLPAGMTMLLSALLGGAGLLRLRRRA